MHAICERPRPNGILNPGKIFHPFEVWDHQTVDKKMPWDH